MKAITQEWVDKAEGDFEAGVTLQGVSAPVYDAICFHAQQLAEKYLKSWLMEQGIAFPKTHDLETLAKLALTTLPELATHLSGLRLLTSFAVEIRYPGTSALRADADRCWQIAIQARSLVRAKLGK